MRKTIKINKSQSRAIIYEYSDQPPIRLPKITNNPNEKIERKETEIGTADYERAVRRAFSNAKLLAFFNPDLTKFLTFTYAENMTNVDQALHDIKMMIKDHKRKNPNKPFKYIYVFEIQKRGAIHIHMMANDVLETRKNKYGYDEIKYWHDRFGYTNVRDVKHADDNFKPYLYLFKYMHKAQRVGKSFIHTSRNLSRPDVSDGMPYEETLANAKVIHQETNQVIIEGDYMYTLTKKYVDLTDAWTIREKTLYNVHQIYRQRDTSCYTTAINNNS